MLVAHVQVPDFSSIARFQRLSIGFDTKSGFAQNTVEEILNVGWEGVVSTAKFENSFYAEPQVLMSHISSGAGG